MQVKQYQNCWKFIFFYSIDTKEQAEKEAHKFDCEGAHQMGDKWMPCSMHKHNH